MSADTLSELRKALEHEREARKRAERELTAWRAETGAGRPEDAGAAIRNTREDLREAERERDEARRLHGKAVLDGSAAVLRAERAEADNAALLEQAPHGEYCASKRSTPRGCDCWKSILPPHPGAALLEYVRALEAALPLAMHDEACQSDVSGTRDPSNCALCAANALKGQP